MQRKFDLTSSLNFIYRYLLFAMQKLSVIELVPNKKMNKINF